MCRYRTLRETLVIRSGMFICAVGLAWAIAQGDRAGPELVAIHELEPDAFA